MNEDWGFLTIKGAAERLGLSAWAVRRWIWAGALPVVTVSGRRGKGCRLLIDPRDLENLIRRLKRQATAKPSEVWLGVARRGKVS